MIDVRKTEVFVQWLDGLRDVQARARVQARIERLATGNPVDVEPVGESVSELRIDHGPGYRGVFLKTRLRADHSPGRRKQEQSGQRQKAALRLARDLSE